MDGHYLCSRQKWVYECLGNILGFYRCYFFHTITIKFFSNYLEKSVKKIPVI